MTDSFTRWIGLELDKKEKLRQLPSVDAVVKMLAGMEEAASINSLFLTEGAREAVSYFREQLLQSGAGSVAISAAAIARRALSIAGRLNKNSLGKVINATGVIVHTNLGRSLLAPEAIKAVQEAAGNYINLEMDLATGKRGERHEHVLSLLSRLTGAESSLVVNNNAAAVLLVLSSLAQGREVVVSRGELVEIGGAFRIPAVLALSGARLVEVGTTNKTGIADYREAINSETALLLKVHTSNYRIVGFTSAATAAELVALGKECGLPVVEDLGSGVLWDLQPAGIKDEPTVPKLLQTGVDIICFSGDKLLGG
ncbi:MAG TPA: L-seryl-tRNA(Sec) selenium transferase, partial [Firmicutes bacterium]|nr:L-seryl-tRNA(Sec) selenium transferase [Bacillota bacterium]